MKTRILGSSGIKVSEIGLGGMPLSIAGRPEESQGIQVIHGALAAGMTLIDTADVYCIDNDDIGHNERLIRKALDQWSGDVSRLLVGTKGGLRRPKGQWTLNGKPEHLKAACEASLKALNVESIGLYQLHAPDNEVPLADSVGALARLQEAGKIQHIGLSNVDVSEIKIAQGIVDVVSVQNRCNILDRQSFDNGVVAYCEEAGIAFLPHSPVGGHRGHPRLGESSLIESIAEAYGASTYEVVLAWLLAVSPSMIPIPGASRVQSALSSARSSALNLDKVDVDRLTQDAA